MTATDVQIDTDAEQIVARTPWPTALLGLIGRYPLGAAGALVVLIMIFSAVFADVIAPYDPESNYYEYMFTSPGAQYWLGADDFGRDIFSRLIYGARTALFVGFVAAIIGATLVLGVASAYFGGWFDLVVQRVMDVIMAFPLIILALAVVAVLGPVSTR